MVEKVKKFTDGLLKNALENKNENGEERITIVLASYQEGQVRGEAEVLDISYFF